ncbi:unnamed protein product [Cylicocyclus nassatus]|uniref:Uncharacterized protein n=1 Tax=Cylicocyclus nassatus TaxID=53992 RepID=A0AA36DNN1_CYLNA|nr:unnamed protein product [Cylicocyclus nassatus]
MFSQPFLILILVHLCAAGCLDWLCCWKGNDDDGSCKNVREAKRTAAACVSLCIRRGSCRRHYGYFGEPLPKCRKCIGKCLKKHGLENPYDKPAQGNRTIGSKEE